MCADPGSLQNGGQIAYYENRIVSYPASNTAMEYPAGTKLSYDCRAGYLLDGEKNITCISNGNWSPDKPRCIEDCGFSSTRTGGKITHGLKTKSGEFPWVVFLRMDGKTCGGVLLNHKTVLTAAHCFDEHDSCRLYFGKYNRSDSQDDEDVVTRESSKIIKHPEYDGNNFNNDIAMVKFSVDVDYSSRILPICMPTSDTTAANIVPGRQGYLAGWGLNERRLTSPELMLALLPVQYPHICVESFQRKKIDLRITPGLYCGGFKDHQDESRITNACSGDSGSPMVFLNNSTERFTLEGLVSHGDAGNCDMRDKYTMFTKVAYFRQWIFHNM